MADQNRRAVVLDPRRNQTIERKKLFEEMLLKEMPGSSRANEPMHAVLEGELGESEMVEGREAQNVRNHALIHYLATLANSNDNKDTFDFDFVESLLKNGADLNSTDKTGQTVFHEVARSWNIDVATFLIKHGANVNQQDQYGRSPLHVAAAVDYAEMVEFLLENGADIDIKTTGEGQAAIHFAAKNDAINSLQMLLGYGANIDARDSKNRTPLQVSAEMNRSKAAKLLIAEGAPAGVYDNLGNSALSLLIEKIPEVAFDAMDQFHSVDTINRKEFYFLNYLEGTKLKKQKTPARTPLEIAVQNERYDIIMHPIMQRLIGVKWQMYGKWGAVLDLAVNLIYTLLWTVLAVTLPKYGRDLYIPLTSHIWRLVIVFIIILLTLVEIRKQIINTIKTRHELKKWREWRAAELERDLAYCHPRWPQEAQYLRAEIKAVRNLSLISGSDWWIYFDWAALVLILATIASHVTFFHYSNDTSKKVHHYIIIPLLLILWFRIFKYARPFEGAGPFVVIFGHVWGDIIKWGFLNSIIVIPFTCIFWITFGAISLNPVSGYDSVSPLLYNMFSMMVVNDHNYDALETANPFMARLLCGAFIGIAAIVTLNLLIALLSNTFERLYENAVENAVMQRARTILLLQKSLRKKQKKRYYEFIKTNGSPEVIVKTLGRLLTMDGDDHATIERVGDDVKVIVKILGEKFGRKFGKGKKSDLDFVKMDVSKVRRFQEELIVDVKNMKQALQTITEKVDEINRSSNNNNNNNNNNTEDGNNTNSSVSTSLPVVKPPAKLSLQTEKKNLKQRLQKITEKSSQEESETSETETDSESTTKNNQEKGWIKSKSGHSNRRKSSVFKNLFDKRKKHTKSSKQQQYDLESIDPHTKNQQLAYPPKADRQNAGFSFDQHSYPQNHYPQIQNHVPSQTNQPIVAYNQVSQRENQWFTTTPGSDRQQHHLPIQNTHLQQRQDFDQQSGHMRQPANWYFHKNSSNMSVHHLPTVKNLTTMQSSPYDRKSLANNSLQQPPGMRNTEESYQYQNYGFQPIHQDVSQIMPTGYENRQMVQNQPVFIDSKAKPNTSSMTSLVLREPIGSQYSPVITQVPTPHHQNDKNEIHHLPKSMLSPEINSEFQKKGMQQYLMKRRITPTESTPHIENKTAQAREVNTTYDKPVPHVDVQLVMDRHPEGSRSTDHNSNVLMAEISQHPTQHKVKPEERKRDTLDTSFGPEMFTETASLQPGKKMSEEPNVGANKNIVHQEAAIKTTQVIPEIDVLPVKTTEPSLLTTSPTNDRDSYNLYRPSTPISPDILEKVTYFQGKIDESHSKEFGNNTHQNEIKMSRGTPDAPLTIVSTQSQSPAAMISNDAPLADKTSTNRDVPLSHPDATEFKLDNATKVSTSKARNEEGKRSSAEESKSTYTPDDSNDDLQNIVKPETNEVTLSQKTFVHTQEDQQDVQDQTQQLPKELQPADDNEIHEELSHGDTENDITDGVLSEEVAVTGMKGDPLPSIGWV